MPTDGELNPFASPWRGATSLAAGEHRDLALEPPILIDGVFLLPELLEANQLMTRVIQHRGIRAAFYFVLAFATVWMTWVLLHRLTLPGASIFYFCAMLWYLQLRNGPLARRRIAAAARSQMLLERRIHGQVTSAGITIFPDPDAPNDSAFAAGVSLPWNVFVEARLGVSSIVLKRHETVETRRFIFEHITRGLFRTESEWQRFRNYVAVRFNMLPGEVVEAKCGRCRQTYAVAELAPPTLLLRWLWPPLLIDHWLSDGRRTSYCGRCRRSVSASLFFIGFMLAIIAGLFLFAPRRQSSDPHVRVDTRS